MHPGNLGGTQAGGSDGNYPFSTLCLTWRETAATFCMIFWQRQASFAGTALTSLGTGGTALVYRVGYRAEGHIFIHQAPPAFQVE